MKKLRKPRVYILHPITSSGHMIQNIRAAAWAWRYLITQGYVPYCPGLVDYSANMAVEPMTYEEWMAYDKVWMELCDVGWREPGYSRGANREEAQLRRAGKSVFTKYANIEKWKNEVYYPGLKSTSTKGTPSSRSKKKGRSQPSSGGSTRKKGRR